MSDRHNHSGEPQTESREPGAADDKAEQRSGTYYYDDSTNYETYREDDDNEPTPTDEDAG